LRIRSKVDLAEQVLFSLGLLAFGGLMGANLYLGRLRLEAGERQRLAGQAKVIDDNLGRQLAAVDHALASLQNDLPRLLSAIDGIRLLDERLQVLSGAMPGVRTLFVLDRQGRAIASNRPALIGQELQERAYFKLARQTNDPNVLHVSSPIRNALGTYAINLERSLVDARGAFAGLVAITLDPDYFTTLLNSVNYAPDSWTSLAHGDGTLFVMVPDQKISAGNDLLKSGSLFSRHMASGQAKTVLTGRILATGEWRMAARRTVRPPSLPMDNPLVIAVTRSVSAIFAPWRRDLGLQGGLYALVALASWGGLLSRQKRRRALAQLAGTREELLRNREATFRTLFEQSPDPVSLSRLDTGEIVQVNQAWCDLVQLPADQVLGRTARDLGLWAELQDRERFYAALRDGSQATQLETNLVPQGGGDPVHVVFTARLVELRGETHVLLVIKDLTLVHRSVLALKASEERYRALFDLSPDGICLIRLRDQALVEVNRAWEGLTGYARAEALGRTTAELGIYPHEEQRAAFYQDLAETGTIVGRTVLIKDKAGTIRNLQMTVSTLELRGERKLLVVSRDVSREVALQAALKESEAMYRELMTAQGEGFGVVDAQERFVLANPVAERTFGVARGALPGRSLLDFLAPDQRAIVQAETRRRLGGSSSSYELRILREDGTERTLLATVTPRHGEDGRLDQAIGVFRDITELRLKEEAERRADKAESLVLMAGSIAHDFNNLFAALQASLEVLAMQIPPSPETDGTVRTAKEVLRRAITLSWKMNDFSGRVVSRMTLIHLPDLISQWLAEKDARRITFTCGEVPAILGDRSKLREVLDVLWKNALEAMDAADLPAGRVRLDLRSDSGGEGPREGTHGLWVNPRPDLPATVCLAFANDGPCPGPEVLARMFDPFFTTKFLGRGLGLASALGLLRVHHAGIQVLPGEPAGIAFRLHFPPAEARPL